MRGRCQFTERRSLFRNGEGEVADSYFDPRRVRGYDGLGGVGYQKHFRDNEFANDESHLNGSWGRRMQAS